MYDNDCDDEIGDVDNDDLIGAMTTKLTKMLEIQPYCNKRER